jgi:hypothetical protein
MGNLLVHQRVANYFGSDAQQFLRRHELLDGADSHALWRVKAFVDLLMAAECALKAHIVLGSRADPMEDVLHKIKRLSHGIQGLADEANRVHPSPLYEPVKQRLSRFHVQTRYALEAEQSFFPADDNDETRREGLDTFAMIAFNPFRIAAAKEVHALIDALPQPVSAAMGGAYGNSTGNTRIVQQSQPKKHSKQK